MMAWVRGFDDDFVQLSHVESFTVAQTDAQTWAVTINTSESEYVFNYYDERAEAKAAVMEIIKAADLEAVIIEDVKEGEDNG